MSKFYWLKLPRDFFKRHDMKILGSMPDGDALQNILIRLMTESIDHEGKLRFSDEIPYDMKMLSAVMDTDEDTMKTAMDTFTNLGLVELLGDGTYFLPKVVEMIGSATDNDNANRQRRYRENRAKEEQALQNVTDSVTKCNGAVTDSVTKRNERKRLELEKESELELEKEKEKDKRESAGTARTPRQKFKKPSLEEVKAYCDERKNGVDAERFIAYYESVGWRIGGKAPMKDWRAAVRSWEGRESGSGKIAPSNIPYMQKEYSKEHLQEKEQESFDMLDALLAEE